MISALQENFAKSSLKEVKSLEVSLFPSVVVTGEALTFHLKDRGGMPPLFTIRKLTARANLLGLLARHVSEVRLEGLDIHVPPHEDGHPAAKHEQPPRFIIDQIIADGTTLTTIPKDSWKEPLTFGIRYLRLYGGGPADAMKFDAVLMNAETARRDQEQRNLRAVGSRRSGRHRGRRQIYVSRCRFVSLQRYRRQTVLRWRISWLSRTY